MKKEPKYNLSFTAASLRLNEMIRLADLALKHDTGKLAEKETRSLIITNASQRTTDREFREIRKRIEKLTEDQLNILAHGDLVSQKQMAFIGVCKTYNFIKEFTVEVIREKILSFEYVIYEGDYHSFLQRKTDLYPQLENFSGSTLRKAKQVMFHILEQAGIIDDKTARNIQPQLIDPQLADAVVKDDPEWLKVLLVPDKDIERYKA